MKKFPGLLRYLEFVDQGNPVDKAIVIRDCGQRPVVDVENEMRAKIARMNYRFPQGVELCAVKQETETWLLADETAISVAAEGKNVGVVNGNLENFIDPKEKLIRLL